MARIKLKSLGFQVGDIVKLTYDSADPGRTVVLNKKVNSHYQNNYDYIGWWWQYTDATDEEKESDTWDTEDSFKLVSRASLIKNRIKQLKEA